MSHTYDFTTLALEIKRVLDLHAFAEIEGHPRFVDMHGTSKHIQAIKDLRADTGLGLKEAKDLADAIARAGVKRQNAQQRMDEIMHGLTLLTASERASLRDRIDRLDRGY